jgi:hypothetical protein
MNPLATLMLIVASYAFGFDDCASGPNINPKITSSSQSAKITVVRNNRPEANTKVSVSMNPPTELQLSTARPAMPDQTFVADSHGIVVLKDLPIGVVYVSAASEHHYRSALTLRVASTGKDEISSFTLNLVDPLPPAPAGIVQAAEQNAVPDRLRALGGTVVDINGALIPEVHIEVYRRGSYSQGQPIAEAWVDQARFKVQLAPDVYTVITRAWAFKADVRIIEISSRGRGDELQEKLRPDYDCSKPVTATAVDPDEDYAQTH